MSTLSPAFEQLKPLEKAIAYLEELACRGEAKDGKRLPTTRELSALISVSPGTARNAFTQLAAEGKVDIRPGNGVFWKGNADLGESRELVIGTNSFKGQMPDVGNPWARQIYGGILHRSLQEEQSIHLKPLPQETLRALLAGNDPASQLQGLNGCILMPSPQSAAVGAAVERAGVPCVYYNPPFFGATAHFASPDYFSATEKLGKVFYRTGRRHLLMILAPGPSRSTSCKLLTAGLLSGLAAEGSSLPEVNGLHVRRNATEDAYEAFMTHMKGRPSPPDAVSLSLAF